MKTRPTADDSNAEWMGSLCPSLTAMPLKYLAVPGGSANDLLLAFR